MGMRVVGAGEKFRLCHFNKQYDPLAKEMDNPICDEKQVDDCYQSLVQMKFQT